MPTMFMVWEKLRYYYLKKLYTCLTSSLTMSSLSGSIYRRDASCSPTLGSNSWQSLLIWNNTIAQYVKRSYAITSNETLITFQYGKLWKQLNLESPHLDHHQFPNWVFLIHFDLNTQNLAKEKWINQPYI